MLSINELSNICSWATKKWWHLPVAIFVILILLAISCLGFFVKTEDRWKIMTELQSQLVGCLSTQSNWISDNILLIISFIISVLIMTLIFSLAFYYMNKYINEKVENMKTEKDSVEERLNKLKKAYIQLRTAYRKNRGIVVRELQFGITANIVDGDSNEHLQQMNEHDLYIDAERLSRESGVPDDV